MFIYKIANLVNGKCYIGQTRIARAQERIVHHIWCLNNRKHTNKHLQNAWAKYGADNFKFEVIASATSLEELDLLEIAWICELKSNFSQFGYNKESGGVANKTIHLETRRKLSRVGTGRRHKESTKQLLSGLRRGKSPSKEHREALSKSHLGQVAWNRKPVLCIETGKIFESATAAAKAIGTTQGNVSSVCRGERPTTNGFSFRYVTNG